MCQKVKLETQETYDSRCLDFTNFLENYVSESSFIMVNNTVLSSQG